jgi:hypothetical protein
VFSARFALLEAKTAFELGDMQSAGRALRRFEELAREHEKELQREGIEGNALAGRLELEAGGRGGAALALEEGLANLKKFVTSGDASVQSYLWMGECGELRGLMHDIASVEPVLGYGAELCWRDFYRLLGRRLRMSGAEQRRTGPAGDSSPAPLPGDATEAVPSPPGASEGVLDLFRMRAETARGRIEELGAVHCIYLINGDDIWRWTASRAGVHLEVIDASTGDVREYVTGALKMMSGDDLGRSAIPSPELHRRLRALAGLLLPPEVLHAPSTAAEPFFITTDSFLGLIPFETFDIGDGKEYMPLLLRRDVAYLRHADAFVTAAEKAPGVVLVSAMPSKALRKRYPFQPELKEAFAEGETVAALNPDAVFLSGESASKKNLLSVWEKTSFIYMAAHMLRDPQVPYLMLIPLVSPDEIAGPDAAFLDISDIRSADFSNCRTVILSGCSSGAPYLDAGISGPSLGDAFLDSGAGAVVHTFWDIPDSDARRLMTSYVRTWTDPGFSAIHALCRVRREELMSSKHDRHPFGWAAYSIKIGRL